MSEEYRLAAINKYIEYSLNYAGILYKDKKFAEALEIYRELLNYKGFPLCVFKNIGLCMKAIGNADLAIKFLSMG